MRQNSVKNLNEKAPYGVVIIVLWLSFVSYAFYYISYENLNAFDPDGKLEKISREELSVEIAATFSGSQNSVIHFIDDQCECNSNSQRHMEELSMEALAIGYNVIYVNPQNFPNVPSTPSTAIIDSEYNLVYFGPYGAGLLCSQTNGFALTAFKNHIKGFDANMVISDVSGCYCNT